MNNIDTLQPIKLDDNLINVYKGNIFLYDFEEPKTEQSPITITDDGDIIVKHYPPVFEEALEIEDKSNIVIETQFSENFKIDDEIKINLAPKITKLNFNDTLSFDDFISEETN